MLPKAAKDALRVERGMSAARRFRLGGICGAALALLVGAAMALGAAGTWTRASAATGAA